MCVLLQAELRPIEATKGEDEDYTQLDEEDMGMSYAELGVYGYLRKVGPGLWSTSRSMLVNPLLISLSIPLVPLLCNLSSFFLIDYLMVNQVCVCV